MTNSFNPKNGTFRDFQIDSETLVSGMIFADEDGTEFLYKDDYKFGMGRYYNLRGTLFNYDLQYVTNDYFLNGYGRTINEIIVNHNIYSEQVAVVGNYIKFPNGDCYKITDIRDEWDSRVIIPDTKEILSEEKNGSLDDVQFLDANMNPLPKSVLMSYKSQMGFNGKVFRYIARFINDPREIKILNCLCSLATAVVLSLIVVLLLVKYNFVMAACFGVVFLLSPWVVNFARNLYWVEFTWFVPVLIGLFCAWKVDSRIARCISYVLVCAAIVIKCLCGYEYISTIMLSAVAFLIADFIVAVLKRDKAKVLLIFRTTFIFGCFALAGFVIALLIHASCVNVGSIGESLKDIYENLVVRRTIGSATDGIDLGITSSINVSRMTTIKRYFQFSTEIISGIRGSLFSYVCVLPLCVFVIDLCRKKLSFDDVVLYIVFFFAPISWFFLAKAHSYIHTHMNYVLWYFGFVQMCLYIVVNKIIGIFKTLGGLIK